MKKFLEIKGLNVVDEKGNTIAIVEDGIVDIKNKKICSFLLSKKGLIASYYLLPLKSIKGLGNNLVTEERVYSLTRTVVKKTRPDMINAWLGREILDYSGKIAGNLSDLIFDESSGEIRALLCTRGILEDLTGGRRLILCDGRTVLGKERIMIGEDSPEIINDASFKKFLE